MRSSSYIAIGIALLAVVVLVGTQAPLTTFYLEGTLVDQQSGLNLYDGGLISVTSTADPANNRVNYAIGLDPTELNDNFRVEVGSALGASATTTVFDGQFGGGNGRVTHVEILLSCSRDGSISHASVRTYIITSWGGSGFDTVRHTTIVVSGSGHLCSLAMDADEEGLQLTNGDGANAMDWAATLSGFVRYTP